MRIIFLLFVFTLQALSQGNIWIEQVSGVSVSLNSVVATGGFGGTGWTCGNNGTVLRTSNSGTNWINVSGNGIPYDVLLNTITGVPDPDKLNHALVAGLRMDTAIVYRTTDNGASWQVVFRQYNGKINGIEIGVFYGFMVGNPVGGRWSLWRTTNDGLTWDSAGYKIMQNGSETGLNNTIEYNSGGLVAFGTNNSRIYYSVNYGVTWTSAMISGQSSVSDLVVTTSAGRWYYGGTNKVSFTTDFGMNWQDAPGIPNSGAIIGIYTKPREGFDLFGNHDVYISRGDNKILCLKDSLWQVIHTAPSGNYKHISHEVSFAAWAVRDNGGITFYQRSTVGINLIYTEIPRSFSLSQNYPNPFNPVTQIKFDIPKSGFVKITIYDLLGREISTLVNQQMQPGSYNVDWDASNFSSGVYFYKIEVRQTGSSTGDFVESKKMVLVK